MKLHELVGICFLLFVGAFGIMVTETRNELHKRKMERQLNE